VRIVTYMNSTATTTRTALLTEVQNRMDAGEDMGTVIDEVKARPEWEMVARSMGLR